MTNTDIAKAAARASLLQDIHNMEAELTASQARVAELERALQTERDRVMILAADRQQFQNDAKMYRGKLIELATAMANIGLLTNQASEIMMTVRELDRGETKEQAEAERQSAKELVARLTPRTVDEAVAGLEGALRGGVENRSSDTREAQ